MSKDENTGGLAGEFSDAFAKPEAPGAASKTANEEQKPTPNKPKPDASVAYRACRTLLVVLAVLLTARNEAVAQSTKATINTQINTLLPDNTVGQITPQGLRTVTSNIVNSIMPTAPVVGGNLACFNGTTGLLQDCGSAPSSSPIVVAVTPINGGASGSVLYDNAGKVGEYGAIPASVGGTNCSSPSGTCLDNITGFASTGFINRTGAGAYSFNTTIPTANGGSGASNSTNNAGDLLASNGSNGTFVATALNAVCSLVPSVCTRALGYTSIAWYGAKCDGIFQSSQNFDQPSTVISITSGVNLLTSTGSTFTVADVGKRIWVPGAGVAAAGLSTTIASFIDATHITLAVSASTSVASFTVTNNSPLVYGTDDTTAIQAAFSGVPFGGTIYIPSSHTGCVIRQQGANTYSLLQNKPFTIKGDGRYSNLMTFPDIPSTVDNLFVDGTAGYDWTGVSWSGFSIGMSPAYIPPTFIMYKRYGKRGLVLSDSAAGDFVQFNIANLFLGESGNDHSLYIGNGTSSPSQGGNIIGNRIFGGIHLANVSDSFRIQNNFLYGASTFGGLFEFVSGAGGFVFSNNNVTWTGCTILDSGVKPLVINNYFEEVVNGSSCSRAAVVDFNGGVGTVTMPTFTGNIMNISVSTATLARFNNVTGGNFGDSLLIAGTSRTFVTSTTQLNCIAPNSWIGGGTHFSTALANSYAGC